MVNTYVWVWAPGYADLGLEFFYSGVPFIRPAGLVSSFTTDLNLTR